MNRTITCIVSIMVAYFVTSSAMASEDKIMVFINVGPQKYFVQQIGKTEKDQRHYCSSESVSLIARAINAELNAADPFGVDGTQNLRCQGAQLKATMR